MSQISVTFLSIRAEDLPRTPKAFQSYVRAYFREVKLHNQCCFVAVQQPYWLSEPRGKTKGIAPSHTGQINRFQGGLQSGQELSNWIRSEKAKGEKSLLFTFEGNWDDCCDRWDD